MGRYLGPAPRGDPGWPVRQRPAADPLGSADSIETKYQGQIAEHDTRILTLSVLKGFFERPAASRCRT